MGRFEILVFAVALCLVLITDAEGQWQPPEVVSRPLCATQITLANYACSMLQSTALPPPTPTLPSTPLLSADRETKGSPPRRNHRHRHEHDHENTLTPMEVSCCKWIQQLDNECICGLLSQLPVFLARPQHKFSVTVGGSCHATYSCGGVPKS